MTGFRRVLFRSILWRTTKFSIPMNPPTRTTHNLRYRRILCPTNTIKFRKSLLKNTISTPHMLPKLHSSTIPHIIRKEFRKTHPTNPNMSPQANTISTSHLFLHQPPQSFPYFTSIILLHRASISMPYLHNHFPNKAKLKLLNRLIPNPPTCSGLQT